MFAALSKCFSGVLSSSSAIHFSRIYARNILTSGIPNEIPACLYASHTLHPKNSGRPKLPPNSFLIYLKEQKRGQESQTQFVSAAAQRWRELKQYEKQPFVDKQRELAEKYKTELASYQEALSVEMKLAYLQEFRENKAKRKKRMHKKNVMETGPPKRNASPWAFFVKSRFFSIKVDSIKEGGAIMKDARALWLNMTESQKQPYVDEAMADKERYDQEMQEYMGRMKEEGKLHLLPVKYQKQLLSKEKKNTRKKA